MALKKSKIVKGMRFGELTVIGESHKRFSQVYLLCKCSCGNEKAIRRSHLKDGLIHSCGCKQHYWIGQANSKPKNSQVKNDNSARKVLFNRYRHTAKKRGLIFDILESHFYNLTSSNCYYCNTKPQSINFSCNRKGAYYYNGIDRLDNSKGYIDGNIVPCCEKCNRAKLQMSLGEFMDWVYRVCDNLNKKEVNYGS
jgi:hypothetical protein